MFDFYEKRKLRGILYSKFTIALLFLFGLFLSTSVYERYHAEVMAAERRAQRADELYKLQQRASLLEGKVEMLESDRGKEALMREQFDVKRGNEEVVIIVDEDKKREAVATETTPIPVEPPLFHWLKFW
jgi:hypothetical protein